MPLLHFKLVKASAEQTVIAEEYLKLRWILYQPCFYFEVLPVGEEVVIVGLSSQRTYFDLAHGTSHFTWWFHPWLTSALSSNYS
jgi:hypothetical protein